MLSEEARQYVEDNKELLQQNNFQEFFDIIPWNKITELAEFFLLDCDINFLEYMTCIPDSLFSGSNRLESIVIPNSVIKIGDDVFSYCRSLKSIIIPDSVIEIGISAFESCNSLQLVTISNSVTEILDGTFYSCRSLQSVVIPNSVTEIDCDVFAGCESLKEIRLPKRFKNRRLDLLGIDESKTKVIWY